MLSSKSSIARFSATVITSVLLLIGPSVSAQSFGHLSGKLVDADTGTRLVGGSVSIEGTDLSAATDLGGYFRIRNIPEGNHNLVVERSGYQKTSISGITIIAEEVTQFDIPLLSTLEDVYELEVLVVNASEVNTQSLALLKDRQSASSISDAI
jgi:hypothetical protein